MEGPWARAQLSRATKQDSSKAAKRPRTASFAQRAVGERRPSGRAEPERSAGSREGGLSDYNRFREGPPHPGRDRLDGIRGPARLGGAAAGRGGGQGTGEP